MSKIIVAMSGGLDSAVLLALALEWKYDPLCVCIQYGAKADQWEKEAAKKISDHYGVPCLYYPIDISPLFPNHPFMKRSGGELTDGDDTQVPNRNLILLSLMGAVAMQQKANKIWFGAHEMDPGQTRSVDTTGQFCFSASIAIYRGTGGQVEVECPLLKMDLNKENVIRMALEMKVPIELTRICFNDAEIQCGHCSACLSRLRSFKKLGIEDPAPYQDRSRA